MIFIGFPGRHAAKKDTGKNEPRTTYITLSGVSSSRRYYLLSRALYFVCFPRANVLLLSLIFGRHGASAFVASYKEPFALNTRTTSGGYIFLVLPQFDGYSKNVLLHVILFDTNYKRKKQYLIY